MLNPETSRNFSSGDVSFVEQLEEIRVRLRIIVRIMDLFNMLFHPVSIKGDK